MSLKANALLPIAVAALGVTMTAGAGPVCEGVLNDYTVSVFGLAEVDSSGRCIAIVNVDVGDGVKTRAIADASGNVRLFASADSAIAVAKRSKMAANTPVNYKRFIVSGTVGDPVAALKSKYKSAKAEKAGAIKQENALIQKITSAESLGWDDAVGTPEHDEYSDLTARRDSVVEWRTKCGEREAALSAALTAAGIDPATVV